ncbi:zf-TFIIB domain-containing protein [Candidatus Woesearchaeota archaeon]|nr:zf-TFIIB domain-containing protein [Candidatus Woesearchaeota archaeon]
MMKCPECNTNMKKVEVKVHGAQSKVVSYQCENCDSFEFEPQSSLKVVQELRESPLKIKQKVIKLSQDRLGIYFNNNIIRSLNLKSGSDISVSVPDKRHIILELDEICN